MDGPRELTQAGSEKRIRVPGVVDARDLANQTRHLLDERSQPFRIGILGPTHSIFAVLNHLASLLIGQPAVGENIALHSVSRRFEIGGKTQRLPQQPSGEAH